jgi:hypothetical protein
MYNSLSPSAALDLATILPFLVAGALDLEAVEDFDAVDFDAVDDLEAVDLDPDALEAVDLLLVEDFVVAIM